MLGSFFFAWTVWPGGWSSRAKAPDKRTPEQDFLPQSLPAPKWFLVKTYPWMRTVWKRVEISTAFWNLGNIFGKMYNSKIRTAPKFYLCLLVNLTPTPFPQLLKYQKHDNYCKCKHFHRSKNFPLSSEFAPSKEEIPLAQIIGIKFYFLRNFNFSNKIWTL